MQVILQFNSPSSFHFNNVPDSFLLSSKDYFGTEIYDKVFIKYFLLVITRSMRVCYLTVITVSNKKIPTVSFSLFLTVSSQKIITRCFYNFLL